MPDIDTIAPDKAVLTDSELNVLFHGTLPVEEDIIQRDHRTCNCALTYVHRKRHAALGTAIEIRLCCMAQAVEKFMGLPPGTFFTAIDFEPSWVWDCNRVDKLRRTQPDGSVVEIEHRLGPPRRWLRERMAKKGVEIRNLPPGKERDEQF